MWERFTERAKRVIFYAQEEAGAAEVLQVTPGHILLGLLCEPDSVAGRTFAVLGTEKLVVEAAIRAQNPPPPPRNPWVLKKYVSREMELSRRGKRAIDLCYHESLSLSDPKMNTGHLLLGVLREGGDAARVLREAGITLEAGRTAVRHAGTGSDSED